MHKQLTNTPSIPNLGNWSGYLNDEVISMANGKREHSLEDSLPDALRSMGYINF